MRAVLAGALGAGLMLGGLVSAEAQVPPAPAAPTVTAAATNGHSTLAVSWSAPAVPDGTTPPAITAYDLRHIRTDADEAVGANWTLGENVWTGTGDLAHSISGLTTSTGYDVQVRARNADGTGDWSDTGAGTTGPLTASFDAGSYRIDEGEAATVTMGLSGVHSADVVLTLNVTGQTTELGDYSIDGTADLVQRGFRITAGNTSRTFTLTANQDDDSDNEALTLRLNRNLPSPVTAGAHGTATVTLVDDDLVTTTIHLEPNIANPDPETFIHTGASRTRPEGEWVAHLAFSAAVTDLGFDDVEAENITLVRYFPPAPEFYYVGLTFAEVAREDYTVTIKNKSDWTVSPAAGTGTVQGFTFTMTVEGEPTTPGAPTNLIAEAGNGQVTLTWATPQYTPVGGTAEDDTTITRYQYSSDGGTSWANIPDSAHGRSNAASYTVTRKSDGTGALVNNTEYTFVVRAVNDQGAGDGSERMTATPAAVPAAPTGLSITFVDDRGTVTLRWDDPGDSTITGYQFRQRAAGAASWNPDWPDDAALNAGSGATVISHTVAGLTVGGTYTFEVRAVNAAGHGTAAGVRAALAAPVVVTGLAAVPGNGKVTLTWDDPGNSGIDGYQVSRDGGTWQEIPGSGASTTSHTVDGLTNGTAYRFQVRATNVFGEGVSAEVTAAPVPELVLRPVPGAPQRVTAEAGGEAAALQVELRAEGDRIPVRSFTAQVRARDAGKVADVASVRVYLDVNGNGRREASERLLGEEAPNAGGAVTIAGTSLNVAPGEAVNLVFVLRFRPTLIAAAGVGLMMGGVLTFAAARRRRRRGGSGRSAAAGRIVAAAVLGLAVAFAVAACQEAVSPRQQPQPSQQRTYQLALTAVEVAAGFAVRPLPEGGITGAAVIIDQ